MERLARVLVRHSLAIGAGDELLVRAPATAADLVVAVHAEALRAGAHPSVRLDLPALAEARLRDASLDQLRHVSEPEAREYECFDAQLVVAAGPGPRPPAGVDPARIAAIQESRAPLMGRAIERIARGELRWCTTAFPTEAAAAAAGMPLGDYEDFVFAAGLLDAEDPVAAWAALHARQEAVVRFLGDVGELRFVAPGTDLTLSVARRRWMNGSGQFNFPDGEVFTGPVEDSAEGVVSFSCPARWGGQPVEGIRLWFEGGAVVRAEASSGQELLDAALATDAGARRLGEVAFGLNPAVRRPTGDALFDEKLDGTMHLALGRSYPLTGGSNASGIHWDLVCDLREGAVYADGEICHEGGAFRLPETGQTRPRLSVVANDGGNPDG